MKILNQEVVFNRAFSELGKECKASDHTFSKLGVEFDFSVIDDGCSFRIITKMGKLQTFTTVVYEAVNDPGFMAIIDNMVLSMLFSDRISKLIIENING